ncbi:MAG: glycosyltransferase family 9 protein [Candidatus Omnitrophica bacterium]|nr:glycosyltransferase family 9 protein [Candidatus Omnitrophota bacterium]
MDYIFKNRAGIFFMFLFDLIGGFIFLPFLLFKKTRPGNVGNILIIRLDDISDVIFSTVAALNLKAHYKGAKITMLTNSFARDAVIDNPHIDEIICYDAPWLCQRNTNKFSLTGFLKLANELKGHRYDIGVDLKGDIRHIFLMALAGIKFRIGYGAMGGGFLLHKKAQYMPYLHNIEQGSNLLKELGAGITENKPKLYISAANEGIARSILDDAGIQNGDFVAVMHTVADCPSKNWLDRKFAALARVIREQYNARIVLLGDESDKRKINEMAALSGVDIINACGKCSFQVMAALIKKASLFVGIDALPANLAALQGVASVILCSCAWPDDKWPGIEEKVVRIRRDISCKGCYMPDCAQNICMDLISVDDAVEAVADVLEARHKNIKAF